VDRWFSVVGVVAHAAIFIVKIMIQQLNITSYVLEKKTPNKTKDLLFQAKHYFGTPYFPAHFE
jgi:hypothetical protein